jgi:hypothetical protein
MAHSASPGFRLIEIFRKEKDGIRAFFSGKSTLFPPTAGLLMAAIS